MSQKTRRRAAVSRPGTGGFLPRATPFSYTSATAELIEELGQPWRLPYHRAQLLVWYAEPDGTGIVVGRLSGQELQHGETAMNQVHQARSLAHSMGRRERLIVVTLNNSGGRDYELRPDFLLIEEAVREGWCRWTAWRDIYRVAREPAHGERFFKFIRDHDVDLLLSDMGRATVWERDRLTLRILSAVGAEQRADITRRTHDQLRRLWVEKGRGWPGAKRFGFRRNPITKYLEVDPLQWPFVLRIHHGYAALTDESPHGLRRLSAELALMGCSLHPTRLRTILSDTIYCDGRWGVRRGSEFVWQRQIPLHDPVPWPVFQRNQQLLGKRRGKNTRTPQGLFCLNRIELVHLDCAHVRDAGGRQMNMRGRVQQGRDRREYEHNSPVPRDCYGFRVPQGILERAVLGELRAAAAQSEELLSGWKSARPFAGVLTRPAFDARARRAIKQRLGQLQRQRERLERYFVDRLAAGENVDERDYRELVDAVRAEEDQLRARLKTVEAAPTALGPVTPGDAGEGSGPRDALQRAVNEVLSDDVPQDAGARIRREELVCLLCPRVEIADGGAGLYITAYSVLVN